MPRSHELQSHGERLAGAGGRGEAASAGGRAGGAAEAPAGRRGAGAQRGRLPAPGLSAVLRGCGVLTSAGAGRGARPGALQGAEPGARSRPGRGPAMLAPAPGEPKGSGCPLCWAVPALSRLLVNSLERRRRRQRRRCCSNSGWSGAWVFLLLMEGCDSPPASQPAPGPLILGPWSAPSFPKHFRARNTVRCGPKTLQ